MQHVVEMKTPEFLNAVSEHCHFVDREVKDVTNSLKRNVLYCHFCWQLFAKSSRQSWIRFAVDSTFTMVPFTTVG
jgi:hypothetical protein